MSKRQYQRTQPHHFLVAVNGLRLDHHYVEVTGARTLRSCSGRLAQPQKVCTESVSLFSPSASGHFSFHLTPKLAHPANRASQAGLRGPQPKLLIAQPAHEGA